MEETEETEVPLSNREVIKVLKARENMETNKDIADMITYLETTITQKDKYPLEKLRDIKKSEGLEASLITLAILSNTQDLTILSSSDKKRILKALG